LAASALCAVDTAYIEEELGVDHTLGEIAEHSYAGSVEEFELAS